MALRGFQERKMFRKVVFSAPVAVILWAAITWMLWNTFSLWGAKIKINQRNGEIEKEITKAEESRIVIERKSESLKSEYGIDLEARSKFNLTKPGEKVVIFADEQNKDLIYDKNKSLFGSIRNWLADFLNFSQHEK